ncbi:type IV pilin protein [Populibacterium corticicola]|uniref:Type IV pilin protein n=1 Tax=Populibacterium corticicola TaxID=1812826 RepID=A0ABW5XDD2_9MICO
MIARVAKAMNEKEKGFTLIELLVVVVIIGILAAVAIPQFLKYRENAWRSAVTQDVTNATRALEAASTLNNGEYPDDVAEDGSDLEGYNNSDGVTLDYSTSDNLTYTLVGEHAKLDGKTYTYSSDTGIGVWND